MKGFQLDIDQSPTPISDAGEQTIPIILSRKVETESGSAQVNFARIELTGKQSEYVIYKLLEFSGLGVEFLEQRAELLKRKK